MISKKIMRFLWNLSIRRAIKNHRRASQWAFMKAWENCTVGDDDLLNEFLDMQDKGEELLTRLLKP